MQKLALTKTVEPNDPATACDFLAACTSLSKIRIKDAMTKGAVWLKKTKRQAAASAPGLRQPKTR